MICLLGKCYCGKRCKINHEVKEQICTCNGDHKICQHKCNSCKSLCVCIAKHKGNHECLLCFKNSLKDTNNDKA
jgi:hypothetical protein